MKCVICGAEMRTNKDNGNNVYLCPDCKKTRVTIDLIGDIPRTEKTIDERATRAEYLRTVEHAKELLKDSNVQQGKCKGIYGAFNRDTGECIYIGKSKSQMNSRWREHARRWKKDKPIHRQPLMTQYFYFFGDQIIWKALLPVGDGIDNDLIEYCERRLFEKYQPIANSIIPNGTIFGRSIMEGEGESISVSEWNPNMATIRIRKGNFNGFSDGKDHFEHVDSSRNPDREKSKK